MQDALIHVVDYMLQYELINGIIIYLCQASQPVI